MQEKTVKKNLFLKPDQSSNWFKGKAFDQRKTSQIRQVQFHGSRHRG